MNLEVCKSILFTDLNYKNIPENGYLIAEIFHIFRIEILFQEYLDGHFCPIPYTVKDFSKEACIKKYHEYRKQPTI